MFCAWCQHHLNCNCMWNVKSVCFVDALGHCEHLMIRGKSKKEMEPVFQDHCILYIPIRANVTGEKTGMCELLSLRLPNSPFTGLKKTQNRALPTMDLWNIFLQPKFDFHLISFIICKYLVISTTCRWFNKGQVPAFVSLWQRDARNPVSDRMWIARSTVHMAKKQGASFQPRCG